MLGKTCAGSMLWSDRTVTDRTDEDHNSVTLKSLLKGLGMDGRGCVRVCPPVVERLLVWEMEMGPGSLTTPSGDLGEHTQHNSR